MTVKVLPLAASNRVFADANGNGIEDSGEQGVPVVLAVLYDSLGNEVRSAVTDDQGFFALGLTGLAKGVYTVRFFLPPGLEGMPYSPQDQGGNDTRDSDVDQTGESGDFLYTPRVGWQDLGAGIVLDPTDPAFAYLFE